MPAIQVVLFDLGGTLLHYEQPPEHSFDAINGRAMRAFLQAAADEGTRVPDVTLAIRAVARMAAALEARATRTQHAASAELVIRDGLEAVGVKPREKAWDAGLRAYYAVVSSVVAPVGEDTQAVLARLTEQGCSLGLVSNTYWQPAIHDADLERFGLLQYLPVRVYSSQFGMAKPHPSIYRQALDELNVAPAEAVFVGDKLLVDVAGPQKIGMRAILFLSPFRQEEDPQITPDARIRSLSELPALLDAWEQVIEKQIP